MRLYLIKRVEQAEQTEAFTMFKEAKGRRRAAQIGEACVSQNSGGDLEGGHRARLPDGTNDWWSPRGWRAGF
jgi:hypothetical protein